MSKLVDIAGYLVANYPYPGQLSNARLTKMIYLADWYHTVLTGRRLTEINWYFDHYGPYVKDVFESLLYF